MLDELLTIKQHRKTTAERAVNHARLAQAKATQTLLDEKAALQSLRCDHETRERTMYGDLCSRIVKLADIESVCSAVAQMHEAQTRQDDVIHECMKQLAQCDEQLASVRIRLQAAMRKVEKYVQLLSDLGEQVLAENERYEDAEMEECASRTSVSRTEDDLMKI